MSGSLLLALIAMVVLLLMAAPLLVAGVLGLRGTLRTGGLLGVRTPAALRGEDTFRLANRVAALPWIVAGSIALVGGLMCLVLPTTGAVIVVFAVVAVGSVVIAAAGGVLGHRAAEALPAPVTTGGGCGGCMCGQGGCAAG